MAAAEVTASQVTEKIAALFSDGSKEHKDIQGVLLVYLSIGENETDCSTAWKMLKMVYSNDEMFKLYCRQLYDNNKKSLGETLVNAVLEEDKGVLVLRYQESTKSTIIKAPAFIALSQKEAIRSIVKFSSKEAVALAVVVLAFEAYQSIGRWVRGEISGKQATKYVVDAIMTGVGSVAGAAACVLLAAPTGPVGMAIAGVGGGLVGGIFSENLSSMLTCKIFNLHPDEAVQKAYDYFGVNRNASAKEINDKYHEYCLKYHPDKKDGSREKFQEVQIQLSLIKHARGQRENK